MENDIYSGHLPANGGKNHFYSLGRSAGNKDDFAGNSAAKMSNSPLEVVKEFMEQIHRWETIDDRIIKWINARTFTDGVILTFRDLELRRGIHRLIIGHGMLLVKDPKGRIHSTDYDENSVNKVIMAASSKFSPNSQMTCDRAVDHLLYITWDLPYMISRILNATPYAIDNVGLYNYRWAEDGTGCVSVVYKDREIYVSHIGRIIEAHRIYTCEYGAMKPMLLKLITKKYNLNNFEFSAKALEKYRDIVCISIF